MTSPKIVIVGAGELGDKSRQFLEKFSELEGIGFAISPKVLFAQDYFDGFFQHNGFGTALTDVAQSEDLESRIKSGSLTAQERLILDKSIKRFNGKPLAVRSSAKGDARGTGIYDSVFTGNELSRVETAFLEVLASYFSDNSFLFRKDAQTGDGLGIIVEPIIGHRSDYILAPIFSGIGYTSTSGGDGYVNLNPGLGGGVKRYESISITRNDALENPGNFKVMLKSLEERTGTAGKTISPFWKLIEKPYGNYFDLIDSTTDHDSSLSSLINGKVSRINFIEIFEMMEKMETAFKRPQYFEWALTFKGKKQVWWITQIDGINPKSDMFDFNHPDEVLLECLNGVAGSGIRECNKILYIEDGAGIVETLKKFNKRNKNYVLVYQDRLSEYGKVKDYSDFNNASVLVEVPTMVVTSNTGGHFQGSLDKTNKFFGKLIGGGIHNLTRHLYYDGSAMVYDGKVRVTASEKQERMQVVAIK